MADATTALYLAFVALMLVFALTSTCAACWHSDTILIDAGVDCDGAACIDASAGVAGGDGRN